MPAHKFDLTELSPSLKARKEKYANVVCSSCGHTGSEHYLGRNIQRCNHVTTTLYSEGAAAHIVHKDVHGHPDGYHGIDMKKSCSCKKFIPTP